MSNLERDPVEDVGGGTTAVATAPVRDLLPGREVVIGTRALRVTRTLPNRERRMVGAWCFVDQYGPEEIGSGPGMNIAPHPHTGLQTVSWLVAGEMLHRDSLGNEQLIRPGQLNLMTAGRAIAHAEESPADHTPILHGVQLWVALPQAYQWIDPDFDHHADLPVIAGKSAMVTVLIGDVDGAVSPARSYSPLVGAEVALHGPARVPLRPEFEHAAVTLGGRADVDGVDLAPGSLLYLGTGRSDLALDARAPARVLLLGGEPFEEQIVMWWNFVARSHDEIVRIREDWEAGRGYGPVPGYGEGDRLPAPPLPTTPLKARPRAPRNIA